MRFHPDADHLRQGRALRAGAACSSMARSKAYLFGGVEIRWSLRAVADQGQGHRRRKRPCSISPAASKDYLRLRDHGADEFQVTTRYLRRQHRERESKPRLGRMGRDLVRRPTASAAPTATPFRQARAARTRTASVRRLRRACASIAERDRQQARRDRSRPRTS